MLEPVRPKPIVLLILDGWGVGPANAGNAITRAHTPNLKRFALTYPHTQLTASGEAVGLPHGESGNTETGHLNLGAGKIVYQDLPRINMSIADGSFSRVPAFLAACEHTKRHASNLHLMGLVGAGGVHSNIDHLFALLVTAKQAGLTHGVYLHLFTDGRDSPPTSGITYISQVLEHCKTIGVGTVATIMGRYFAMDRDKRWDRTQLAYEVLTSGKAPCSADPLATIQERYNAGETDEFIRPFCVTSAGQPPVYIKDNDAVIFFNFRIDRPRQLTKAFVLPDFEGGITSEGFDPYAVKYKGKHIQETTPTTTFKRKVVLNNLFFVTMTEYERGLPVQVAFPPQSVDMPIGRVLEQRGLKQLRVSETEKERFVTYYFNGLREDPFEGEHRIIIPSAQVATYDQKPEMSANDIMSTVLEKIGDNTYDFICVNFANADMVSHTGNIEATIKACEVVDTCVGTIAHFVNQKGGVTCITADHGNAEEMINAHTGEVDTEHSSYPVPLLIVGKAFEGKNIRIPTGILADVAPTLLHLMGIPKPETMTGRILV